jgi:hypothetical protein
MKMTIKALITFPVCPPLVCVGLLAYSAEQICSHALDRINDWIEK